MSVSPAPTHRVAVADIPGMDDALRSAGILTAEDARRLDALERAQFCLVRIDGMGERWRCGNCNGKHTHFTHGCIPIPYRGLRDGLRAYWQNTAIPDGDLSPEQREKRRRASDMLGFPGGQNGELVPIPDLFEHHPEMARALGTRERSTDIGVWVLGTIDVLTPARARLYAAQINARARRVIVRI